MTTNKTKQQKIDDLVGAIITYCRSDSCSHAMPKFGGRDIVAYMLATVEWETAHTFDPVREAFWLSEDWRRKNLRYYPYYGRGYVQITFLENYQRYQNRLGIPLVDNPDLALDPDVATQIMVDGFFSGGFTGAKITDYINSERTDFVGARRCINGTDRNKEIADIARQFADGSDWRLV